MNHLNTVAPKQKGSSSFWIILKKRRSRRLKKIKKSIAMSTTLQMDSLL
jgi:hypothetical protein